jgi:uncharacterized RDD family membrane protein YckC
MHTVGIETAQNVVVRHEVASLGDRIVAYLIDALIVWSWFIGGVLMLVFLYDKIDRKGDAEWVLLFLFFLLVVMPVFLYDLVCELAMDGQSIGKRARKIKVARLDGGQPRLGQYLLRWLLRPIDSFYYLGLLVILINGKGQRLGDLAAGTAVVSLKPRLKLADTVVAEVPADHRVRFPGAIRLSDAQAALVREVLNNTTAHNRWAFIEELAAKVRTVIGDDGAGMKAMEFLETVLRDFVYLTRGQEAKR